MSAQMKLPASHTALHEDEMMYTTGGAAVDTVARAVVAVGGAAALLVVGGVAARAILSVFGGQGGLAELEAVKDGVRSAAMAMPSIEGTMQLFVVDTQLTVGRADEAITTIAEVLPRIVVRHETYVRAEMWRLQGEALLQSGQPAAKATALFSQALAAAQADGATLLELRAACSLARLAPSDVEALARVARSLARMAPQPALEDWTSAMALLQGRTVAHLTA